jgi:hypothetical protein
MKKSRHFTFALNFVFLAALPGASEGGCGVAPLRQAGGNYAIQLEAYKNCVENEAFWQKQRSLGRQYQQSLQRPLADRGKGPDGSSDEPQDAAIQIPFLPVPLPF